MRSPCFAGVPLLAGLLLLAACETKPAGLEDLPPELRQAEVVSVRSPGARMPPSGPFVWAPGSGVAPSSGLDTGKLDGLVRSTIRDRLGQRGYESTPAVGDPVLFVGYFVATESALPDEQLDRLFGLATGGSTRRGALADHEKGTIVVDLIDARTRRSLWRGAVSGVVAPQLQPDVRRQRIETGLDRLFASLPR